MAPSTPPSHHPKRISTPTPPDPDTQSETSSRWDYGESTGSLSTRSSTPPPRIPGIIDPAPPGAKASRDYATGTITGPTGTRKVLIPVPRAWLDAAKGTAVRSPSPLRGAAARYGGPVRHYGYRVEKPVVWHRHPFEVVRDVNVFEDLHAALCKRGG